ncbi:MAG: hypothetical protein EB101_08560 [Chitinophagia bacterium]|nr:hypothetical protein [Chitinophagia bacterium]
MKRYTLHTLFSLLLVVAALGTVQAQQPGINIEAIAKDRDNNPAKDRRIYVRIDIVAASATNTPAFSEEHVTRTNEAGIFQVAVGKGIRQGGTYNSILDIPWRSLNYLVRIRVAIEPVINVINWNYQNEWIDLGTTPFGIVPYAGAALTADNVAQNAAVISINGGTTGLTPSTPTSGHVTLGGILNITNGGTGSSIKNFVDLSTTQSINGAKTLQQLLTASGGLHVLNNLSLTNNTTPLLLNGNSGNPGDILVSQGAGATPVWMNPRQISTIKSKNRSVLLSSAELYEITVNGLDNDDGISVVLEASATPNPIPSYYIVRDTVNNKIRVHFTAPFSGYVTWVIAE